MRIRLLVPALVASAFLVACGGASKGAASPETDPWADYKGTFAGPLQAPAHTTGASIRTEPVPAEEPAEAAIEPVAEDPKPVEAKRAKSGGSKKGAKRGARAK